MNGSLMQPLPTNVLMALVAASEKTPLEKMAAWADKIMEVVLPSIATVHDYTITGSERGGQFAG